MRKNGISRKCIVTLLLALARVPCIHAQMSDDAHDKGVTARTVVDCDTFARVAKQFLNDRGVRVSKGYTKVDEDWACGQNYRCIVFQNAPPIAADGKSLRRDEVVSEYLKEPATVDFRPKNFGHGYWAIADHNF